jgi:hypothetical protein
MARKIVAEVTQPVHDPVTGEVTHEPGTQFPEGDKALKGLTPAMYRYVVVEAEPEKAPAKAEPEKATPKQAAESGKK